MYELTKEIPTLYHSADRRDVESIQKEGLRTDDLGMVYLAEKPIEGFDVAFLVTIPNQSQLADWREIWYNDDEEIDMDHQYDDDNPYYIYLGPIAPEYLKLV